MAMHPRRTASPSLRFTARTGARQTGKTTLVHDLLPASGGPAAVHFPLDDPEERLRLAPDPVRRLDHGARLVLLDDVQKQPGLLDAAKLLAGRSEGRRLLPLGSAQTDPAAPWQTEPPSLHFFPTHAGHEVDFVLHAADRLLAIEVKASRQAHRPDARALVEVLGTLHVKSVPDARSSGGFSPLPHRFLTEPHVILPRLGDRQREKRPATNVVTPHRRGT